MFWTGRAYHLQPSGDIHAPMSFAATEWEFRARFWFIFGIFTLGFQLYFLDRINVCAAIGRCIYRGRRERPAASTI